VTRRTLKKLKMTAFLYLKRSWSSQCTGRGRQNGQNGGEAPFQTTAELLWVAQSHTGDYHDNMNSDMFMKWVKGKLVPTFEKLHPGKNMVLVADNAPYHHKREIGSLASLTKSQLVDLMTKHEVNYVDLPATDIRVEVHQDGNWDDIQDMSFMRKTKACLAASKPA
jgi:hypothetical protein